MSKVNLREIDLSLSPPIKPHSTSRNVWRLAWPTIVSNLLFTTVGFLHIKIVAQLGTTAVAAVTTGHRVFFLVQAILMGVSVASTALISRSWGAQQVRHAELVSWTSLVIIRGSGDRAQRTDSLCTGGHSGAVRTG